MTHKACKPECAVILGQKINLARQRKKEQAERAVTKAQKESLKSRSAWMKETQTALNSWVRLVRDAGKPCISCGRHHQGQNHAGHYLSRGAHPNLALVECNIFLQCAPCNVHLHGNQANMRLGIIARYGVGLVEQLESDNEPRKYDIPKLKELRDYYRRLVRESKGK